MEILSEIAVLTAPLAPWAISFMIISAVITFLFVNLKQPVLAFILITTFLISIICVFLSFTAGLKEEKQYKVVFHEPVMINEFLDKYEVLKIEGHILTIKEREK